VDVAAAVAVVTPYHAQIRAIQQACGVAGVTDMCEVCTIDRFQGKDRDVVILSSGRTPSVTSAAAVCCSITVSVQFFFLMYYDTIV
jgi:hypothetical protein